MKPTTEVTSAEVTMSRRIRATLTRNLALTAWGLGSAWATAHLLLPLLEQRGLAVPVIWLRDGAR